MVNIMLEYPSCFIGDHLLVEPITITSCSSVEANNLLDHVRRDFQKHTE